MSARIKSVAVNVKENKVFITTNLHLKEYERVEYRPCDNATLDDKLTDLYSETLSGSVKMLASAKKYYDAQLKCLNYSWYANVESIHESDRYYHTNFRMKMIRYIARNCGASLITTGEDKTDKAQLKRMYESYKESWICIERYWQEHKIEQATAAVRCKLFPSLVAIYSCDEYGCERVYVAPEKNYDNSLGLLRVDSAVHCVYEGYDEEESDHIFDLLGYSEKKIEDLSDDDAYIIACVSGFI